MFQHKYGWKKNIMWWALDIENFHLFIYMMQSKTRDEFINHLLIELKSVPPEIQIQYLKMCNEFNLNIEKLANEHFKFGPENKIEMKRYDKK
jgi:hypothetical protein